MNLTYVIYACFDPVEVMIGSTWLKQFAPEMIAKPLALKKNHICITLAYHLSGEKKSLLCKLSSVPHDV